MKKLSLKQCFNALISFVYPSFCLHCDEYLNEPRLLLCRPCAEALEWIDKKECCSLCAAPLEEHIAICKRCRHRKCFLHPHVSLFLPFGPIAHVWRAFCMRKDDSLTRLFASLCVFKLTQLPWPLPSALIPVPESRIETFSYRKQGSVLIAHALSKLLDIPIYTALERTADDTLALKARCRIAPDHKVLLVVGNLFDGELLAHAKKLVRGLFPLSIYSLAVIEERGRFHSL